MNIIYHFFGNIAERTEQLTSFDGNSHVPQTLPYRRSILCAYCLQTFLISSQHGTSWNFK